MRCNELENPIGIETENLGISIPELFSCNELENPIGIETDKTQTTRIIERTVATNLKTR